MFNKDCYIVIPVMETVHDDIIQYKRIVYRYFCIKCRKSFLNKKEYDEHCCEKYKFVNNE